MRLNSCCGGSSFPVMGGRREGIIVISGGLENRENRNEMKGRRFDLTQDASWFYVV